MSLHGSLKNYEKKALFQLERKTVKIVINRWKQRFLSFIRLLWVYKYSVPNFGPASHYMFHSSSRKKIKILIRLKIQWKNWKNVFPNEFWGRWLQISNQMFIIQNGGFRMAIAETKKHNDFDKHMYLKVFGVADNESIIRISEFKMADSRRRTQKRKKNDDRDENMLRCFRCCR